MKSWIKIGTCGKFTVYEDEKTNRLSCQIRGVLFHESATISELLSWLDSWYIVKMKSDPWRVTPEDYKIFTNGIGRQEISKRFGL